MVNKVDMHVHTNLSNGSESLEYVLTDAQRNEVQVLSISDINTLQAYFNMENINVRDYYQGSVVVGVEVNCHFDRFCSDMLAYNIKDLNLLQSWLNKNTGRDNTVEAQKEQLEHYKKVAREIKAKFDEEIDLSKEVPYAGKVIASSLAKYKENYSIIPGIENPMNFFVEHCANINSPFYYDLSHYRPLIEDFINIVHKCGGLVFVAHPFAYVEGKNELEEYLNICKKYGVDGVECFQCYNEDTIYATELPIEFCKKNNLFISGGTDFHKKSGDLRYSGVGLLGSEKIKNYASYIPKELVDPWIQPMQIKNMGVTK